MLQVGITPPKEIHDVYSKLKELGEDELRRNLTKAIREATRPAKEAVKASELAHFPRRGGLAKRMAARTKITNRVRQSRRDPGVIITVSDEFDVSALNRGRLRHKTFGRLPWRDQVIEKGIITNPLEALRPSVARDIEAELQKVSKRFNN